MVNPIYIAPSHILKSQISVKLIKALKYLKSEISPGLVKIYAGELKADPSATAANEDDLRLRGYTRLLVLSFNYQRKDVAQTARI
jgi:hypothetical protein